MPAPRPAPLARMQHAIGSAPALAFLVFAAAWLLFELAMPATVLHCDTYEDLLRARTCVEDERCPTEGVTTSFRSITQGALWINLLAVLRGLGLSVDAIRSLTFALAAAGIAIVFACLRRRPAGDVAWATAGLLWIGLALGDVLHVPWNPSLIPLPAALLFVLALQHADGGRWWMVLPLGSALGLTLESHPIAVLVMPGTLLLAGVAGSSRIAACVLPGATALIALGLHAAISPSALQRNVATVLEQAPPSTLIVALVLITAAAVALRRRFAASSPRVRGIATASLLAGPMLAGLALRSALDPDAHLAARYLAPALPAFAFLLAELASPWLTRRAVRIGFAVVLLECVIAASLESEETSFAALDAVREKLEADGVTLDEAWARVSGPRCELVLGGLAALGMPISGPAMGEMRHGSLIVGLQLDEPVWDDPDAALGRGRWSPIPEGAIIGEIDTWVDRRRFSVCVESDGDGPSCVERDLRDGVRALSPRATLDLSQLARPEVEWRTPAQHAQRARRAVYRLPIRVPPRAGRRTILVPPARDERCARVRFLSAERVRVASALPAGEVVVESTEAEQRGTLLLEVDATRCAEHAVFPPCTSEVADGDTEALRRVLVGD